MPANILWYINNPLIFIPHSIVILTLCKQSLTLFAKPTPFPPKVHFPSEPLALLRGNGVGFATFIITVG